MSGLLKNSIIYSVLRVLEKCLSFFMMPLYTRYLSPEDFGSFSLILSINAFLILLYTLSLENGLSRFYYKNKKNENKLFSTVFICVLILSILFSIINISILNYFYYDFYQDEKFLFLMNIGLLCIAFSPIFIIFKKFYQVKQSSKEFGIISIAHTLTMIIVNIVLIVLLNQKALGLLIGLLTANIIFFGYSTFVFVKRYKLIFDIKLLISLSKYSLPFLPHSISNVTTSMCDRLMVGYFLSLYAVGLYTIATQISLIMSVLINAFSMAYTPYFFEKMNAGEEGKNKLLYISNICIPLFILIGFTLAIFSKEIVTIMASKQYIESYKYAGILIFVFVFQAIYIFSAGPLLINDSKKYASVSILSSLINIVCNYFLIPLFGLYGAALATLIQKVISLSVYTYLGKKTPYKVDYRVGYYTCISFVFFTLTLIVNSYNYSEILMLITIKIIILILSIVILIANNRDLSNYIIKIPLRKKK